MKGIHNNFTAHIDCSQSTIFPYYCRDRALCITGGHLAWLSKLLRGRGRFGRKREKIFFLLFSLLSPRAIIPDARLLGTFENQDSRDGKTRYIWTISRKNRGLWTVYETHCSWNFWKLFGLAIVCTIDWIVMLGRRLLSFRSNFLR